MDTLNQPVPKELAEVETSLYNRMLRNAFLGFMKSAAIGAAVGFAIGCALAACVGAGLIPALPFIAAGGEAVITAGMHVAVAIGSLAGSFGAVAGIQSTRDTRKFFRIDESPYSSPEDTRSPAQVIQITAPQPERAVTRFEVIDKNTPGYLDRIGKKELSMLVHMLEDLDHSALEKTKLHYGFDPASNRWNEESLAAYKNGRLRERIANENYTFFLLRDDKGETIALASGNAAEDKSQLRLLNLATDRVHKGQGHEAELLKQVSHYAAEEKFHSIVMPVSEHAVAKGEVSQLGALGDSLGIGMAVRAHPRDPHSVELTAAPKKFHSLSHVPASEARDLPASRSLPGFFH